MVVGLRDRFVVKNRLALMAEIVIELSLIGAIKRIVQFGDWLLIVDLGTANGAIYRH
jgi:hypothetical protein